MSDSPKQPTQIQFSHIDEFAEYARNSNTHSEEQLSKLEAIINELGWTQPIAKHSTMGMAAGHGRLQAARRIYQKGGRIRMADGYELPQWFVPWIDVSAWNENQLRAYVHIDNEIARQSEVDPAMLAAEFALLRADVPLLDVVFDDLKMIDGPEEAGTTQLNMPDVTPVKDTFWVTLSGPMEKQAKAMQIIKQALGLWPDLTVDQGVMRHE